MLNRRRVLLGGIIVTCSTSMLTSEAHARGPIKLIFKIIGGIFASTKRFVVTGISKVTKHPIVENTAKEAKREAIRLGVSKSVEKIIEISEGELLIQIEDAFSGEITIQNDTKKRYSVGTLYSIVKKPGIFGPGKEVKRKKVKNMKGIEPNTSYPHTGLNLGAAPSTPGTYYLQLVLLDNNKVIAKSPPEKFHCLTKGAIEKCNC